MDPAPLLLDRAKEIVNNSEMLEKFAGLNGMSVELARETLNRLLREPQISDRTMSYIFDSDSLKSFCAGEEIGYKKGHELGWVKGAATVAVATLGLIASAAVTLLKMKR